MPQNVRIEGAIVEAIIEARTMEPGKAYIITAGGSTDWPVGTVAFRSYERLVGIGPGVERTGSEMSVHHGIKVRNLRAGEKITIVGS